MTTTKPVIRYRSRPGSEPASNRLISDPLITTAKKRQPNKGSWVKGTCPNPKGRPKGAKGVKAITRKVLTEKITLGGAKGPKRVQFYEALLRKEAELAAKGDWRARQTIYSLGRWALGDITETVQALTAVAGPAENITETGQEILNFFAEEIRAEMVAGELAATATFKPECE